jgi:hypothetical protein
VQPTERQRLTGPVTHSTWALLASLGLLAFGVGGLGALVTRGEWHWESLLAFLLGFGGLLDLILRPGNSKSRPTHGENDQ